MKQLLCKSVVFLKMLFKGFIPLFFNPEREKLLPEAIEKMNTKFDYLSKFIGEKPFALGYLTVIDFGLAEYSHYIKKLLQKHMQNMDF